MRTRTIASAVIAGILVLGIYTLNILFTEGMSFSKGSYEYQVTISSDAIKSFPVIGPVGESVYYYSSGDGPSPSVQQITYTSSFDEAVLVNRISAFLASRRFEIEGDFFIKGDDEISVTYRRKAPNLVEVQAMHTRRP